MAASHKASILMLLIIQNIMTRILTDPADMTHFLITVLHAVVNLGHYCFLNRQFSSCEEPGLKRSASYPLIHSESFQLATTEGEHANQCNNDLLLWAESLYAKLIIVFLPHRPRNAAHRGHAESVSNQQKGAVGLLSIYKCSQAAAGLHSLTYTLLNICPHTEKTP